ncbi:ABC transporter substrate-binding protein [Neolewinella lacunae]|uniref:ABC transporter substrate-binding protein n=1 Tax=Neolewinella lacunae TaxID=1517758 RepID=A0A923PKJ4_9BACT|nr:ABC transporter substrate-binding protein [Neolewinella lacunae]MBC6992989.1 ABC transporter substrate-binding protein [Neolewinella lacunae]MDN3635779.1 ABC transporter substrate-binding protein [Neolewinella lacunae]
MRNLPLLFLFSFLFVACSPAAEPVTEADTATKTSPRIVSLSGTLTELLFALGQGDALVGVDVTSTYPAATAELPKLGHVSKLNVEALLGLQPDLIFVDAAVTNNPALKTLADAGVRVVYVPLRPTLDNAVQATATLAGHLDLPEASIATVKANLQRDSLALAAALQGANTRPRVLFLYARGAGQVLVAGTGTEAEAIIQLAGGTNAIQSFADFKPLTPEAFVEAAPDVILMFSSGLASLDGPAGLANIPGIAQTPAFQRKRIVAMDGQYLLGFGPRAAQAAAELAGQLHLPDPQ